MLAHTRELFLKLKILDSINSVQVATFMCSFTKDYLTFLKNILYITVISMHMKQEMPTNCIFHFIEIIVQEHK